MAEHALILTPKTLAKVSFNTFILFFIFINMMAGQKGYVQTYNIIPPTLRTANKVNVLKKLKLSKHCKTVVRTLVFQYVQV